MSFFQLSGNGKTKGNVSTKSAPVAPKPELKPTSNVKRPVSASAPGPANKRMNLDSDVQKHLSYKDLSPASQSEQPTATEETTSPEIKNLQLTYQVGDIFDAPKNCLIIHACNTEGHWGAGIALAFKKRYPKAYAAHNKYCTKDHNKVNPVPTGTTQLLAPVDGEPEHWVGCLFTSALYGKAKDNPAQILESTEASMVMLLELVEKADEDQGGDGNKISEIRMCKINSGKFGVPWVKTEEVLQGIVLQRGWRTNIEVWEQ